jgi:hypothetical protein
MSRIFRKLGADWFLEKQFLSLLPKITSVYAPVSVMISVGSSSVSCSSTIRAAF